MLSKKIIITITITTQLFLIFFYIYTQSLIIQLTYTVQDAERSITELQKRKKNLTNQLLQAQEVAPLKKYAEEKLQMKKARLTDIKPC